MDTSQLRICFIEVLRNLDRNGVNQFNSLPDAIARQAAARGFINVQERGKEQLEASDINKTREVFWSFIVQGIIMPGLNVSNPNLPFFTLTDYGKTVISSPDPIPYDSDGYMNHLKTMAPNLNPIAIAYVQEGLDCFIRGNYTASTVMLGVGGEALMLDLAQALQEALPNAEAIKMKKSIEHDKISGIYTEFNRHFVPRITTLPNSLRDGLQLLLDGVFTIIRTHRNEAGHPTGILSDRLTTLGLFSMFPFYCKRVSQLIDHLRSHPF